VKNSAQTNRHYENNGHLAVNQYTHACTLTHARTHHGLTAIFHVNLSLPVSVPVFSALLVGRQEEHLPCKKLSNEVLAWFSLERDANDLHMVQLMPLPPHHLLLH